MTDKVEPNALEELIAIVPKDETFNHMQMQAFLREHDAFVVYERDISISDMLKGKKAEVKAKCKEFFEHRENIRNELNAGYQLVKEILLYKSAMAIAERYGTMIMEDAKLKQKGEAGLPEHRAETLKELFTRAFESANFDNYEETFQRVAQLYVLLNERGIPIECFGKISSEYVYDLSKILDFIHPKKEIDNPLGSKSGAISISGSNIEFSVGLGYYKDKKKIIKGFTDLINPVIIDVRISPIPLEADHFKRRFEEFKRARCTISMDDVDYRRVRYMI